MVPANGSPASRVEKRLLFCPRCGHESPIDGDWVVREDDRRIVYACPECGTTINARPRF